MQEDRSLEQRLKTRSETEVSITIPKGVFLDDLLCERSSSNLDHHSISIIRSQELVLMNEQIYGLVRLS